MPINTQRDLSRKEGDAPNFWVNLGIFPQYTEFQNAKMYQNDSLSYESSKVCGNCRAAPKPQIETHFLYEIQKLLEAFFLRRFYTSKPNFRFLR